MASSGPVVGELVYPVECSQEDDGFFLEVVWHGGGGVFSKRRGYMRETEAKRGGIKGNISEGGGVDDVDGDAGSDIGRPAVVIP